MDRRLIFVALMVGLVIAACGDGDQSADTTPTTSTPVTTLDDQTTATTTASEATTTTVAATTTTTLEATTTTNLAVESAIVIDDVETEDGWRYRVNVTPLESSPDSSLGGCVETAPPGQTNLQFVIVVTSLINDRSAPNPQFVVSSNLVGDGSVAATDPFSEETIRGRTSQNVSEVAPAQPDTACILANGPGEGDQSIDASGELRFQATLGPIDEDEISSFRGGIRVFTAIGQAVEAEFGTLPGSGEIIGAIDLISDG